MTQFLPLGLRLKSFRISKNLNSKNVANSININRSYLSKIENGHEKPSREVLDNLIRHYSLSVVDAAELYLLAGYKDASADAPTFQGGNNMENPQNQKVQDPGPGFQVNVGNTTVFYTDSAYVTTSQWGLVIDFAQGVGPTNQQNVVSRVGMSKSHAKALAEVILKKLSEEDSKTN